MSDSEMKAIAERMANRRKSLGMSYQDLADETGLSKSTLQRYETGDIKNIPLSKLRVLANALQTTPSDLMGWDDPVDYYTDTDAFRDRMKDEYGVLFDLADKADDHQLKQIESIIRTIVGEDE